MQIKMNPQVSTDFYVEAWRADNPQAAYKTLLQQINAAKVLWPETLKNVRMAGTPIPKPPKEK